MTTTGTHTQPIQPTPTPPRKRHHWVRNTLAVIGGLIVLIIVISVATAGHSTQHTSAPAPAPTHSSAPAVAPTHAPAKPAAPVTLLTFTGHGNESTPAFTTHGDYTVTWTYSGNVDTTEGSSLPSNFIMNLNTTGQGPDIGFNGVNDISASGSGNQTVSGDSGSHYLTVQAIGDWTVKVTAVP